MTEKATVCAIVAIAAIQEANATTASTADRETSESKIEHPMKGEQRPVSNTEAEMRQVEALYSTRPKRVVLGNRAYMIPANYFGPKEKNEPDTLVVGDAGFGFLLFLPEFNGYTKENWKDPFDLSLVNVLQVKTVDRRRMIRQRDGSYKPISPSAYGDATGRFKALRSLYEENPSLREYGLDGYRRKGANPSIGWTGTRSNGEFHFLECSTVPHKHHRTYPVHPTCTTQYYSAEEDLRIAYRFSQERLSQWREIDDAVWAKLHSWEVDNGKGK